MTVGVRVGAADEIVLVPGAVVEGVDQTLHRVRGGRIHADLAVVVDGHETPGRVDLRAHDFDGGAVHFVDQRPVVDGRAAERVDAEAHAGGLDDIEVDDVAEVLNVVLAEVEAFDEVGLDGLLERDALDVLEVGQQFVGALGDRVGRFGRGRAAGRRIVLEAAVGGRVVRRGDDNAVGEVVAGEALRAVGRAVVRQDRLGDDRRRGEVVARIDAHAHTVGDQHLDGGLPCRQGQGVGVTTKIQRAGDACGLAVLGDGLRDGDDVGLVERGLQGGAAVAGRAEAHALLGDVDVGDDVIVLADDFVDVDQISWGGGKTRVCCYHTFNCATSFGCSPEGVPTYGNDR